MRSAREASARDARTGPREAVLSAVENRDARREADATRGRPDRVQKGSAEIPEETILALL